MAQYKNIELDDSLLGVIKHMDTIEEYREVLQNLQTVWDNLTLLGQLSGTGTDMSGTRQAFSHLTSTLLNQLAAETLKKCIQEMTGKAQVSIDILVRNLFERTADIGFLATDDDIRRFIAEVNLSHDDESKSDVFEAQCAHLRSRFTEYVAKYSVYSDIILLDTDGNVLVRLDESQSVPSTSDPILRESLETEEAYVEAYRHIDLLPQHKQSLVYAYRITDEHDRAIGVLCLCFRFENEMAGIFRDLVAEDDWSVILLLDQQGNVVASSDGFHIPIGIQVEKVTGVPFRIVRFMGQEYLAVTCNTNGYQGYMGPGWCGHVMLPILHAFNQENADALKHIDEDALTAVMESPSLFGEALRNIPIEADLIQRDLNRSVWNGNVRQSSSTNSLNPSFTKILLWEISNTGNRTKSVFSRSIANLHETVVSSILEDSRFIASLAIDIMDRNLYERANDCRWWAMTSAFRELLSMPKLPDDAESQMASILKTINDLYTVYTNLFVFDTHGRILAVSNPAEAALVGDVIQESWVKQALAIPTTQGYAVSAFDSTPLYGDRHTYIYSAAIRSPDGRKIVGGVGIVFDSELQFSSMLDESLPRDSEGKPLDGCFGLFVEPCGRIISSTNPQYKAGENIPVDSAFLDLENGADHAGIVLLNGYYYALGSRMSAGYREYKSGQDDYQNDVIALVFMPLCEAIAQSSTAIHIPPMNIRSNHADGNATVEIATFHVGQTWFGVRSSQVIEAVTQNRLVNIPGTEKEFAGCMMYGDKPIPVFNIRSLAGMNVNCNHAQCPIIILKKDDDKYFGILADGLGDIPEISLSRLQPLPGFFLDGNIMVESLINNDNDPGGDMLMVLNVSSMADQLMCTHAESIQQTVMAA